MSPAALTVTHLEDRLVPTGQVVGTVFLDFNANGVIDAAGTLANAGGTGSTPTRADAGVGGVVVTAFDSANVAQGSATSAASGAYTLALSNTGPYRLEFTNVPANLFTGPQAAGGTGSGTTVQFVADNPPATPINLSLVQPTDSSATNPNLLSNIYILGENSGATIVTFPFSSGTANSDPTVSNYAVNTPTSVADNSQVGATWGLAFDTANGNAYAAALTKRHTAYGPGGPGAIYAIDPTGASAPTLFVNLGAAAAGANVRGALGTGYDYTTDNAAFAGVGKSGLGGLAIDDTGSFMYTVGLADRKLYRIGINANGTAGAVTTYNIPLPATVTGVGGANGAYGDLRPFAVEYHNGVVYVGAVNSAESTGLASDLKAYIFAFNPASSGGPAFVNLAGAGTTTQAVYTQALNYPRGYAHLGDTQPNHISANWNAWTDTKTTLANTAGGERYAIYPQPELTGLAFDSNGNLTLGLRDRNGDQYGNFLTTDFVGTPAPGSKGISAGDTLRATIVTPGNLSSGWTAETITAAPPTNITGPTAGGQFFWQQDLPPNAVAGVDDHQALMDGGVLQLPGSSLVAVTGFDPIHIGGNYDLGGVRWFDTTGGNAGGINKAYQAYLNSPTGFAKANGIGDLIAATPLDREIGNRVWNDANGNGRQDAGELGIQNVQVVLVSVSSGGVVTPISTATTDASGNYYFSSAAGASTAAALYGVNQLRGSPPAGGSFQVRIPQNDPTLTGLGLTLTTFQAAGANAQNNSDGVTAGTDYAIQNVGTQRLGTAQHTNDIGFLLAPTGQLSGFVYEDANPSNTLNAGDVALSGVTVVLTGTLNAGGTLSPLTTTTDGTGFYSFSGLAAGSYTVTETQPAGYLNRGEQFGTTGGTAPQDGTHINAIPLAIAGNSQSNNFGEVRPVQLSGVVYHDINNDGTFNGGDATLNGVTVVLTGVNDLGATITPVTSVTAGAGAYAFTALRPGTYSVSETQPSGYTTRTNNPGTTFAPGTGTAGTVAGDVIQSVVLNSNANSPNNNFGEILAANGQLSGFVYEDNDRSSSKNAGDAAISGVTVVLTGTLTAGGATITPRTTTTDGTGFYQFTSLQPGSYTVNETQPGAYLDFNDQIGTTNGTVGNDVLSAIPIDNAANNNSQSNNFGEVRPVQLSGFVYHDITNDGTFNGGDAAIAGVTVVLTGVNDLGATITPQTTTTDGTGFYQFTALRPGDYSVSETQPANFTTRTNNPGTTFAPGTGAAGTVAGDVIQTIRLNSNANSPNNNFGEILSANAQLSGFVYEDANPSNTLNAGDVALSGVTVVLTGTLTAGGATITPRTTTTDGTGFYQFTTLQPGSYTVTETQPAGYLNRGEQFGTTGGTAPQDGTHINTIPIVSGANSQNNNFGEVRPVQLSGVVYHDINTSNVFDGGDATLNGVTVVLTGVNDLGATITPQTTTTSGAGAYAFTALRPGTYSVSETQPANFTTRTNNPGTTFAPGTGTAGTVAGDVIQNVVLNSNANSPSNNFGEVLTPNAQLSGHVYIDANNDGVVQGGELLIAGTTVILTGTLSTGGTAAPRTTTTDGSGFYQFTALLPGTYSVQEIQPTNPINLLTGKNTAGTTTNGTNGTAGAVGDDNIRSVVLNSNGNSPNNDFGELVGAQLFGYTYEDVNDNGVRDLGTDVALVGTTVVLTGTDDLGGVTRTSVTDGTGLYSFTGLRPGTYTVAETQPVGYLNRTNTAGVTANGTTGTVVGDTIQTVGLNSGGNSPNNNFGEVRPAQLSGFVYHDINTTDVFDAGDAALAGVTVVLTGVTDLGATITPVTSTTSGTGAYSFTALRPGTYTVSETQPANFTTRTNNPGTTFAPGTGTAGTVAGDVIQTIRLNSNANNPNNNFGEVLAANAQLSGVVYEDNDNSNSATSTDASIPGVTVVLTGTTIVGRTVTARTTTTDANGRYTFAALQPGTYTVTETQPAGYLNRGEQPGTTGGTAPQNGTVITAIPLASQANSRSNNFGEVRPVQLSGVVYHDINNDGVATAADASIAGVTVVLTGTTDLGAAVAPLTTTTDSNGRYAFTGLRPGTYTVSETQPAGYLNRTNNPGTVTNGTPGTVVGDSIQTVVLRSSANSPFNNFGEVRPGTLSGVVYEDNDNTNSATAGDASIAGVTVVLVGTPNQGGAAVTLTTTTDSNGRYSFTNLLPGNYTVTEAQPAGYLNRGEQVGSTGGGAPQDGTHLVYIPVNQGASVGNNFGEVRLAQLSGVVYQDLNNDGVATAADASIAGVTVVLTGTTDLGAAVAPLTTTTDSNGRYAFTGLRPGTYTVSETQPAGFTTRTNNPGTVTNGTPGTVVGDSIQTVVLRSSANSPLNNFGEVLTANGQINGFVYRDPNLNGAKETGEAGLAGVTVTLLREDGVGLLTPVGVAQTDSTGFYSFAGLTPGNYRVAETQPAGFYSTKDTPGSTGGAAGGNNTIAQIPLALTQTSANNNFGEVPRTNLFGFVWVDANKNGVFDTGETPIPGARVTINGTAFAGSSIAQSLTAGQANGTLTSVTDANGRWEFTSLPPGTYNLQQTNTPAGLSDFASQNASGTTVQTSTATSFGGVTAQGTAQGPLNFGKVNSVSPPPPTKQDFLGSSNTLSGAGATAVNTTPPFGVSNPNAATLVAVGAGAGSAPTVRVFDYTGKIEKFNFQAFDGGMTGGVRTAVGDVNGDGTPDIIAASGPGFEPRVRVFSGTNGALLQDFLAYPQGFRGGVYVAAADTNADGKADIITGAGEGGSPVVRVFSGANLTQLASFFAFDAGLTGGVRVAAGDFNGDGRADVAAATGPGTTALVRTFSGNGFGQLSQFAPFPNTFAGGAFLAAGDVNGDGKAELVVTPDQGGGPTVQVFNATTGQVQSSFSAYGGNAAGFTGGLRIAVRDVTGDGRADIITGAGLGGASFLRIFSGATFLPVEEYYAFPATQTTGIYIG